MIIKRKGDFRISRKVNPEFEADPFQPREWFYLEYRTYNLRTADWMPKYTWHCLIVRCELEECEKVFDMLTK